ncbi:MAG: hypothetical protein OEW45_10465, partial [Deltaproteobacteria bacterium]|nr:hypothetical protein [Deltaproteobacteria bacterium]
GGSVFFSPSRPVPALENHPGPGVQGASLGIMRHWLFRGLGGKRHPASFCGDPAGNLGNGFLPADAARAHRPESRATNRDSVKVKVGKQADIIDRNNYF